MRAAICVRVSPRPQENVRYSPAIQEAKCREWCEANGHEVVLVIQDILVSGGAANRFASIYAALDTTSFDLFVVSDLSRWTRDEPEVFWFVKKVLSDRGVTLASVDEPWLGSDIPFSATITTAMVEKNYLERKTINAKTRAGLAAARRHKAWGQHFGWAWHPRTMHDHDGLACNKMGIYEYDTPRITALFEAWVRGDSANEIGMRFRIPAGHVRRIVESSGQRLVVGDELWQRAQGREKGYRAARKRAKFGSPYRRLLTCPFCGLYLQHHHRHFYYYECDSKMPGHEWRGLSVRNYVTPAVREVLSALTMPEDDAAALALVPERDDVPWAAKQAAIAEQIERVTLAWVRGHVSEDRYQRTVAILEGERDAVPPPVRPVRERVEVVRNLSVLDFSDTDPEAGALLNRVLREVVTIQLRADRSPVVEVRPEYRHWAAP